MNILITGGSGFLGSALTKYLLNVSHETYQPLMITWASRNVDIQRPNNVEVIGYKQLKTSQIGFDVIINLAGAGIADKRWSSDRKQLLLQSRLQPTQSVLEYINNIENKPKLLISSSAIGWYGAQKNALNSESLSEHSNYSSDDFAHQLCEAWEEKALKATDDGVTVAIVRTGIVIHPTGGMIEKLKLPFSLGLGGQLGSGQQIMSWISLNDWIRAIDFIIQHNTTKELPKTQTYNLTAPVPVSNKVFTKEVGSWLKRPTVFGQPTALLKAIFGEMATLLIDGQKVVPQNLLDMGFVFRDNSIIDTLNKYSK